MKLYDLHQDLMTHLRFRERLQQTQQTDWDMLEGSETDLLIATAFPFPDNDDQLDLVVAELITEELELYRQYVASSDAWQLVTRASDLDSSQKKLLLHIEGLNVFDGIENSWTQLRQWVELGVRSVGTHWNIDNQLGGGTLSPERPLTDLGREVIQFLESNHILFDMAHMGRASFWDAAAVTSRPLYVSHGNTNAVCGNVRNYTDEQLRTIAETDGVIGVFFAGTFVAGKSRPSTIADVVAHINHLKQLIGTRHIAIGSDWGGIVSGGVTGLERVDQIDNLFAALRAIGYTEEELEQIAWRNAERVLRAHLR
jgi:membrane dipeptidase